MRVTTDAVLMRSEDPAAFAEVVRRYEPVVRRVAGSVAGQSADDVAQQVFLSAWMARGQFDAARGSLATWLCGIARNRAIDLVRSEQRHSRQRPLDHAETLACLAEGPVEAVARRAQAAEVRGALARIPAAQRATLTLAYFGDMTHEEIHRRTGQPLGTVKGRLRLGLGALRRELAPAL